MTVRPSSQSFPKPYAFNPFYHMGGFNNRSTGFSFSVAGLDSVHGGVHACGIDPLSVVLGFLHPQPYPLPCCVAEESLALNPKPENAIHLNSGIYLQL